MGMTEDSRVAARLLPAGGAALIDMHRRSAFAQGVGRGQANDAGPDHRDVGSPGHRAIGPAPRPTSNRLLQAH